MPPPCSRDVPAAAGSACCRSPACRDPCAGRPVPGEACTPPPVRAAVAELVVAAVAAPDPGRGQRTCRASGHLTHKLCPGRTRVHGLQRAKDVHPPALDHAWHDHPVRAAQTQGISCASLAAGARSKSMGHLLEGQVVPGVINPYPQRTHTICIRSAPGRDFLNGQKTGAAGQGWAICRVARRARRDKRRATRRSKETGRWAAAGIQRQRHRRLARSTRRSSSPWVVPGRCLRLWLEPCRALFGECVAGNQLRCTATRPSPSIRSSA
jgi:hypothetical protein